MHADAISTNAVLIGSDQPKMYMVFTKCGTANWGVGGRRQLRGLRYDDNRGIQGVGIANGRLAGCNVDHLVTMIVLRAQKTVLL